MSKTTVTDSAGGVTTIKTDRPLGCCGGLVLIMLVALVIGGPAAYFPRWAEVLAYIVEGIVALLITFGLISGASAWAKRTFKGKA